MQNNKHYINSNLKEGVLTLTLDDPKTKNAVSGEMANEIIISLSDFSKDPQSKVLLITGDSNSWGYVPYNKNWTYLQMLLPLTIIREIHFLEDY